MSSVPERSIAVVAAVIRRGDTLLVCRRPKHKRHGGLWEFPGGKVKAGESFEAALCRELAEELGLTLTRAGRILSRSEDPGSLFRIHFVEVEVDGEPDPREHDEVEWAGADRLAQLRLAPADAEFASMCADI